MRRLCIFFVLTGCGLVFMGCVELIAIGTYTGIEQFYKYSTENIVHKTFTQEFDHVLKASKIALEKMNFKISKIDIKEKRTRICACAPSLEIEIFLNSITSNTTRVSVNTSNSKLQKDKATATEVVAQIDVTLWERLATKGNVNFYREYGKELPLIYLEQGYDP